jgi:hypothetical protein
MRWLDAAGAPGVGKSTLFGDPPAFSPVEPPASWRPFLDTAAELAGRAADPVQRRKLRGMNRKAFARMASVAAACCAWPYVQTGFAQRGLAIGARGVDPSPFFAAMPVSLGVVFLVLDESEAVRRNRARGVDRSKWVRPFMEAQRIAIAGLQLRGVRILEVDAHDSIETNRRRIRDFAFGAVEHPDASPPGYCD